MNSVRRVIVRQIQEPFYGLIRYHCKSCNHRFWTMHGYRGHYALFHILKIF